jgi:two-component system sensor histidine kinase QseC
VVGALRLLNAGPVLSPEERREMLEMADRQARRLRVLIEQLLLAAQSDNGRASFLSAASERVEADAVDLLVEAATEARAGACGDRVRLRCDSGLPVRLASDAVLQILGNLVDNACKYGPEDGAVWLLGERDGAQAVLAVEELPPTKVERERVLPLREPAAQPRSNRGGAAPRPVPQVEAPSRPGSTGPVEGLGGQPGPGGLQLAPVAGDPGPTGRFARRSSLWIVPAIRMPG